MLARLLITIEDRDLASALAETNGDTLAIDVGGPDASVADSDRQTDPDLILTDAGRLGARPSEPAFVRAVANLRGAATGPNVIYLACEIDGPADRAAALAAGCLTVLDKAAPLESLAAALRSVTQGWREGALQVLDADPGLAPMRLGDFASRSPGMEQLIKVARRVAESNSSVLILGETGVGKERLAHAIHAEGPRRDEPFVVVNCGAIPETLIESELFGHEKGSFTGAHRTRRGHFEMAHGGTILLDEIGELPLQLQVKLLRVLQEREIQRVGAESSISVDVRVLAATNRDLRSRTATGEFRADLFYRIGVVILTIPPLRERREDIPLMAETCLAQLRGDLRGGAKAISKSAMRALQDYSWPGNVREVVNVIERAMLLCERDMIDVNDLPEEIAEATPAESPRPAHSPEGQVDGLPPSVIESPLRQAKRAWAEVFERTYLDRLLRATNGRINETAKRAGLDPRSLYDKMRHLGLRKEDYR